MKNVARGLASLIALLYFVFGFLYMFIPDGVMATAGLEAVNVLGMATARALIGGSFLAFGILLVMHTVINQETGALRFVILHLLMTIIGRVVSIFIDGSDPSTLRNFVPVSLMLVVSIISLVLFLRGKPVQ